MERLDPDSIFSIFEQGDEAVYEEHGVTEVLDNPYVIMGMVLRGVDQFELMAIMVERKYPEQWGKDKTKIKYKYYNRLFDHMNRIDLTHSHTVYKVSDAFDFEEILLGLSKMLYFYEGIEEYEKCALIKKYLDTLEEAQNATV